MSSGVVEKGPEGWVQPLLPALPPEVAVEVVRFARWRLKEYVLERNGDDDA